MTVFEQLNIITKMVGVQAWSCLPHLRIMTRRSHDCFSTGMYHTSKYATKHDIDPNRCSDDFNFYLKEFTMLKRCFVFIPSLCDLIGQAYYCNPCANRQQDGIVAEK